MSAPNGARALLDDLRAMVHPALREAVERMDPPSAAISAYHLGWTDEHGAATGSGGGKSVRAGLAVLSAAAAGAPPRVGVAGAVAVELVHNFSLLHDDVIDGDEQRRHRATVWTIWGVPEAILAGDAMVVAAQQALIDSGSARALDALRLLQSATSSIIHGQFEDIRFESRQDVTLEQVTAMAWRKTSSLLAASASIGAVLADASSDVEQALYEYGSRLGSAFQLVDDLLGVWGDPTVTGKPVLSDLRSRKKTLPLTYAVQRGLPESDRLRDWLRSDAELTEDELAGIARLIEICGGRDWAMREARANIERGIAALERVDIPPRVRAALLDLAAFVVGRED